MPRSILPALLILAAIPAFTAGPASLAPAAEKMKSEELVARHLAAIGTPGARAAAKSRIMRGTAQVRFFHQSGLGQLAGTSLILSEGQKFRLGMSYTNPQYFGDYFAFDGNQVTTGMANPGARTTLSAFIYAHDFLLREGLIGGVTSLGWVLLDEATRRGGLEYSGIKKVDGQKLHELKYLGRKAAGEFRISFYFDPETYRHVLSLYVLRVPAPLAKYPGQGTSDQLEENYRIREEFSSFKTFDDLTLPCAYKLSMTVEGQNRTFLADWTVDITQVQHNQPLEAGAFIVK